MKRQPWLTLLLLLLVAYLPFQVALNLSPDIDLMSGRVLVLGLFFLWLIKETDQHKFWCHPGLAAGSRSQNKSGATKFWIPAGVYPVLRYGAGRTEGWALVLFFVLSAVSILGAVNQAWGWRKLLFFASIFPLFWLTAALVRNKEHTRKIIYIIIGSAAVSAIVALAQFLAQFIFGLAAVMSFWSVHILPLFSGAGFGSLVASNPSWLVNIGGQTVMRAVGLFPDPHMLAFYLGLTSPFALALAFFGQRHRGIFFTVYCLLLTVLFLTFSRGGYLGLLFSLAVFIFFAWQRFGNKAKKFLGATSLLLVVILLLVGWPVATRLISSFDFREGSNMGRLVVWQDSWEIIKKSPIIGVGLGNYSLAVNFNQDYRNAVTSHNLYLDLLAETGLLGLAAWLTVLGLGGLAAWRKIGSEPVVAFSTLSALAYFGAHSFFETAIFNPTGLAFLMIILALSVAETKEDVL